MMRFAARIALRASTFLVLGATLGITAGEALAIKVGDTFPAYMLTDLGGKAHNLGAQRGYVLLLHFVGTTAEVCVEPGRELEDKFFQVYHSRGLRVFGIDCWNGATSDVERFRDAVGATYPMLQGGRSLAEEAELAYNSFVVVDGQGVVQYVSAGPDASAFDQSTLRVKVEAYLERVSESLANTWGQIKQLFTR